MTATGAFPEENVPLFAVTEPVEYNPADLAPVVVYVPPLMVIVHPPLSVATADPVCAEVVAVTFVMFITAPSAQ